MVTMDEVPTMRLPVPPARLCQVVRATRDPDVPMGRIVRLIGSDPGLSVELLRIANSAYYSPRRRIRSVAQATVFLGLRAVRNHAVSHVLKSVIAQVDLSMIDEQRLWRDILFRGAAAHVIAQTSAYDDPTEAFTTGVVMDSGFVMLVAMAPDAAERLQAACHLPEEQRLAVERSITGTTHPEVFARCARAWGLPDELVDPVALHHAPEQRLARPACQRLRDIARLADLLVAARSGDRDAVSGFLTARREVSGVPCTELSVLLQRIEQELPLLGDLLEMPTPRYRASPAVLMRDAAEAMASINEEYLHANRELRRRNAELDRAASRDALTGVANRRAFSSMITEALRDGVVSLVLFDLDHFKRINDTRGHDVGDDVLVGVCRRVEEVLDDDERLARVGGEEFAVLMPEADPGRAAGRAEAVRAALAGQPIPCRRGEPVAVTGSFGGVTAACDPTWLFRAADKALYASKRGGRDQVTWSDDADLREVSAPRHSGSGGAVAVNEK